MKQILVSRSLSEFLLTSGAGLFARNSRAAELNQAAAHLAHGIFPWIPRPIEVRQGGRQDPGGEELEQQMGHTQQERPATDAVAGAALIVAQPQLFDLVEVDLNLKAPGIGVDRFHGSKGEVRTQQVPRREGKPGDGNNEHAGGQGAVRPDAAQEDYRLPDHDGALPAPHPQDRLVTPQARREAGEQLIDAAGLTKYPGATLASRATTGREVDSLVTAQPPQGKVFLSFQGPQQRAAEDTAVGQPDVAHGRGQAQVLGQSADQGGKRAAFDIEQGPDQDTGPLADFSLPIPIEVGGEDVAVPLEIFGAAGDVLEAMKPVHRGHVLGVGLLGVGSVGNPEQPLGQSLQIERRQGDRRQVRHQGLARQFMSAEQVREALGPVVGGRKDTGAHRARFGLADQHAGKEIAKTGKHFATHQRLKGLQDCGEGKW